MTAIAWAIVFAAVVADNHLRPGNDRVAVSSVFVITALATIVALTFKELFS